MSTVPPLVLAIALITAVGATAIGLTLHSRAIGVRARRWREQVFPSPERARGRPIEQLARDLVRVRATFLALPPGTPMARREGVALAYDDLLAEACQALGITDGSPDGPVGRRPRDCHEVEEAVDRAGIRLLR